MFVKDLCRYRQDTQICQLQGRGDSKPHSFTDTKYFLTFFVKILSYIMHKIAESMTPFDIFHVFVEKSVNWELCCFWALLKPAQIWNWSKNVRCISRKTCSSDLKNIFDHSLERSWYELFGIIKAHGPKNQPLFSPGV